MEINLKRVSGKFNFEAVNPSQHKVQLDANPSIGGEDKGFRPMEMLLIGLGGCSGIDMVNILEKQRQVIEDIAIQIQATRHDDQVPAIFKTIQIHYQFKGDLDESKIQKALTLTFEKYCSVAKILEHSAEIQFTYSLND